ncbi:MAG: hypothetical protein QM594_05940 [Niabella sp.]
MENGKPISINHAKRLAENFSVLFTSTSELIQDISKRDPRIQKYFEKISSNKQYSAFVFDRKLVERFFAFSEDEVDTLLVINGVYEKIDPDDDIKRQGEPTVILVGCKKEKTEEIDAGGVRRELTKYNPIKKSRLDLPATEHPNFTATTIEETKPLTDLDGETPTSFILIR